MLEGLRSDVVIGAVGAGSVGLGKGGCGPDQVDVRKGDGMYRSGVGIGIITKLKSKQLPPVSGILSPVRRTTGQPVSKCVRYADLNEE